MTKCSLCGNMIIKSNTKYYAGTEMQKVSICFDCFSKGNSELMDAGISVCFETKDKER